MSLIDQVVERMNDQLMAMGDDDDTATVTCDLCQRDAADLSWEQVPGEDLVRLTFWCHGEFGERRFTPLALARMHPDLSIPYKDPAFPHDPATTAVAQDVLMERCSPPADFPYYWRVRARENGLCRVQLHQAPAGPFDYSARSGAPAMWLFANVDQWPAWAADHIGEMGERIRTGARTTTERIAGIFKKLYSKPRPTAGRGLYQFAAAPQKAAPVFTTSEGRTLRGRKAKRAAKGKRR